MQNIQLLSVFSSDRVSKATVPDLLRAAAKVKGRMIDTSFAAAHLLERKYVMLVLRRKVGEAVVINGNIRVKVLAVEGDRIKIGIEAPQGVNIVREELLSSTGDGGADIVTERRSPSDVDGKRTA